ncbi:hypothetical protein D3C80_1951670 [compost metagenome]
MTKGEHDQRYNGNGDQHAKPFVNHKQRSVIIDRQPGQQHLRENQHRHACRNHGEHTAPPGKSISHCNHHTLPPASVA